MSEEKRGGNARRSCWSSWLLLTKLFLYRREDDPNRLDF